MKQSEAITLETPISNEKETRKMGLDMLLIKSKKMKGLSFDKIFEDGDFEDVGYWRKANQIHNWFVQNVQGGEDDCGIYEVSQAKLIELRDTCQKVIDTAIIEDGYILAYEHFGDDIERVKEIEKKNGRDVQVVQKDGYIKVYVPGKVIRNADVVAELLPTAEGFFFGRNEYDQYYLEDIKETIDIINNVLDDTDFEEYTIAYHSSW